MLRRGLDLALGAAQAVALLIILALVLLLNRREDLNPLYFDTEEEGDDAGTD